ncbi:HAD family hydrolase [Litchfieldia salsa]|uniref:Putative hydrolase of the HAD superfamily n=1 Tax=Litchfieldia salsa TaxID=930152 RepID=A0A1H0W6I3_9BACI|nr:HAD-IA family hydrolase [Litchfieldia salsa]SDP86382.1 putative hydrolase of the HAD superfamily [Litchfieldia salsa]
MIKAVIFDLDDTLISEKEYIKSGYRHIAQIISNRYNKDTIELYELLMKLFKDSPRNVFNRLLDTLGISYTKKNIIELVEEYRNHLPDIEFFNDVLPCFELLNSKKIKTGVITDGYANAQQQKLNSVKANKYFDEIIVTDELGKQYWKPHPKAFEIMKDKLNVEFNEMVYIGDNPEKDFYISCVYPIRTIRIHRDGIYKNSLYLKNIKENYSIQSLNELNLIVEDNNQNKQKV